MTLDWNNIQTVLLDMDGTLLDRNFDDHFWIHHVPQRWAQKHDTTLDFAQKQLTELFKSQENTLNWTDLDYWSERLKLDIPILKREVEHLIAVHPHVIEFLLFLKQHGKSLWLVTNAHSKTLDLKMRRTNLAPYFDGIVSAHSVGLPKEDDRFWEALQKFIPYDPATTLLGEDSETNLATARRYGIRHLIYVSRFSSVIHPKTSEQFTTIEYFNQLLPEAGSQTVTLPHSLHQSR